MCGKFLGANVLKCLLYVFIKPNIFMCLPYQCGSGSSPAENCESMYDFLATSLVNHTFIIFCTELIDID